MNDSTNNEFHSNRKIVRLILVALTSIAAPNLIFMTASYMMGLSRPLINIDYLVFGLFVVLGRKNIGFILITLAAIVDAFQLVNQVYPFIRISDLLIILQLLPNASSWHYFVVFGILSCVLLVTISVYYIARVTPKPYYLIIANIFIFWFSIYRITNPSELKTAWRVERSVIIDSALLFFVEHRFTGNAANFLVKGEPFSEPTDSAAKAVDLQSLAFNNKHKLIIVAESWGELSNQKLADEIIMPLTRIAKEGSALAKGTTDYVGPTVAGEIRELCGVKLHHLNMSELKNDREECLPYIYRNLGYKTISLHGALGTIYDRKTWYPKIGFLESRFKETGRWHSECKSFPGSCDSEIAANDVSELLSSDTPHFIYWLTLNSHQPYRIEDIKKHRIECDSFSLQPGSEACRMIKLHAQFFHDLSAALSNPNIRPTDILIVGDHPPPLINKDSAESVVVQSVVPWILFSI